ncbi:MAG: CDGSH iron-sulfur domain-containing protein [Paracoccaceae bacterium]
MPASITVVKDGPLALTDVPVLTLSDGSAGETKDTMYLCRCGLSASKPFCDGSHAKQGWSE